VITPTAATVRDRAACLVVLEVITITVEGTGVILCTILGFDTIAAGFPLIACWSMATTIHYGTD